MFEELKVANDHEVHANDKKEFGPLLKYGLKSVKGERIVEQDKSSILDILKPPLSWRIV